MPVSSISDTFGLEFMESFPDNGVQKGFVIPLSDDGPKPFNYIVWLVLDILINVIEYYFRKCGLSSLFSFLSACPL